MMPEREEIVRCIQQYTSAEENSFERFRSAWKFTGWLQSAGTVTEVEEILGYFDEPTRWKLSNVKGKRRDEFLAALFGKERVDRFTLLRNYKDLDNPLAARCLARTLSHASTVKDFEDILEHFNEQDRLSLLKLNRFYSFREGEEAKANVIVPYLLEQMKTVHKPITWNLTLDKTKRTCGFSTPNCVLESGENMIPKVLEVPNLQLKKLVILDTPGNHTVQAFPADYYASMLRVLDGDSKMDLSKLSMIALGVHLILRKPFPQKDFFDRCCSLPALADLAIPSVCFTEELHTTLVLVVSKLKSITIRYVYERERPQWEIPQRIKNVLFSPSSKLEEVKISRAPQRMPLSTNLSKNALLETFDSVIPDTCNGRSTLKRLQFVLLDRGLDLSSKFAHSEDRIIQVLEGNPGLQSLKIDFSFRPRREQFQLSKTPSRLLEYLMSHNDAPVPDFSTFDHAKNQVLGLAYAMVLDFLRWKREVVSACSTLEDAMVVFDQYASKLGVSREFDSINNAAGGGSARNEAQDGNSEIYLISLAYEIIRGHPDKLPRCTPNH